MCSRKESYSLLLPKKILLYNEMIPEGREMYRIMQQTLFHERIVYFKYCIPPQWYMLLATTSKSPAFWLTMLKGELFFLSNPGSAKNWKINHYKQNMQYYMLKTSFQFSLYSSQHWIICNLVLTSLWFRSHFPWQAISATFSKSQHKWSQKFNNSRICEGFIISTTCWPYIKLGLWLALVDRVLIDISYIGLNQKCSTIARLFFLCSNVFYSNDATVW